jgi:A/G-specific adenine glycosylase
MMPADPFPEGSGEHPAVIAEFKDIIYSHYKEHGRSFPWRQTKDPYRILLSEMMLQQTQTERVLPKYHEFLESFPTLHELADASLTDVLYLWKGLGYNRRALALKQIAMTVCSEYGGRLPETQQELLELPMVGPATSAALMAFAYGKPALYLETNIRRVYLYFFFHDLQKVRDKEIYRLLECSLDADDPRSWYYALMDYGVFLRKTIVNPNKRSAHYTKQGEFKNSNRQIRGLLLTLLTQTGPLKLDDLIDSIDFPEERIRRCLGDLRKEGFLQEQYVNESEVLYRIAT